MDGVFACPKCGYELKANGPSAGRDVRCDWCEAWVEVPFIPRVSLPVQRRRSRRMPPGLYWAWGTVGLLAVVLLSIAASRWMHSRANLIQEKRVEGLLASALSDEQSDRLGDAVAEIESALALLRTFEPASSPRLKELSHRRDVLVRREVRAQLEALDAAGPDAEVGQCLTLLARVKAQPALAEFEETILERLQKAAAQSASTELRAAGSDFEAGHSAEAFRRCEHLARTIDHMEGSPRRQTGDDARRLVVRIAERGGVVIEQVAGQFTFGSPASYTTALQPLLAEALRHHGYVTCAEDSPWRSVWEASATFRVAVVVHELLGDDYLQSRNRVSQLNANVALRQNDATVWEQLATARTQVPVPRIPAYQAARLGFGDTPVPEYEKVLYNNARASFVERFGSYLGTLPNRAKLCPSSETSGGATSQANTVGSRP